MVDHQYTEKSLVTQCFKMMAEISKLRRTQAACGFAIGLGTATIDAQYCDIAAEFYRRKQTFNWFVALHPRREMAQAFVKGNFNIGIVISGNKRQLIR